MSHFLQREFSVGIRDTSEVLDDSPTGTPRGSPEGSGGFDRRGERLDPCGSTHRVSGFRVSDFIAPDQAHFTVPRDVGSRRLTLGFYRLAEPGLVLGSCLPVSHLQAVSWAVERTAVGIKTPLLRSQHVPRCTEHMHLYAASGFSVTTTRP